MRKILRYSSKSETPIFLDISKLDSNDQIREAAYGEEIFIKVEAEFEDVLDGIKPITDAIMDKFSNLSLKPNEIEVEFGVRFNSKANIVITSGEVAANFKIVLKWSLE